MKAYTQGEIDYFCGVYAVINACRQILKGKKYFSYNDGCLFYQHLMQYLIDAGKIGEVLHHGTDYDLILRLVEQGSAYAFQKFGVKISYELPYAQTVESFDAASKEIDRRLKEENASCIRIVMRRSLAHQIRKEEYIVFTKFLNRCLLRCEIFCLKNFFHPPLVA